MARKNPFRWGGRQATWLAMAGTVILVSGCSMFSGGNQPESEPAAKPQTAAESQRSAKIERPSAPAASGRAIQSNILMVNDTPITIDEVLYLIRRPVSLAKREGAGPELRDQVTRWVLEVTQQSMGTVLLEAEARHRLTEAHIQSIEQYSSKEVDAQVARGFGGSRTRFADYLSRFGMSLPQYEQIVLRNTIAQQYTRDRFMPMVHIRRSELLDYYDRNIDRYTEPELRELFMITVPHEAMLPSGRTWKRSTASQREMAKQKAREQIYAAQRALRSGQPFAEVAKQYGKDAVAALGGEWGPIGEPLKDPYAEPSRRLFGLPQQGVSEPIQNDLGWFIVKCGTIQGGERPRFDAVQARMRAELADERLGELTNKYMAKLAKKASLSPVEPFVRAATVRALQPSWPPQDPETLEGS